MQSEDICSDVNKIETVALYDILDIPLPPILHQLSEGLVKDLVSLVGVECLVDRFVTLDNFILENVNSI